MKKIILISTLALCISAMNAQVTPAPTPTPVPVPVPMLENPMLTPPTPGQVPTQVPTQVTPTPQAPVVPATIKFKETTFEFGNVIEGDNAIHEFIFTNTGKTPLTLTNVRPGCGCTVSEYTKEPVLPGKTGYVKATYNSKGRPGSFNKSITVNSTGGDLVLTITGNVIADVQKPVSPIIVKPN